MLNDKIAEFEAHLLSLKMQREVYCGENRELTREEYERLCRAAERKHIILNDLRILGINKERIIDYNFPL